MDLWPTLQPARSSSLMGWTVPLPSESLAESLCAGHLRWASARPPLYDAHEEGELSNDYSTLDLFNAVRVTCSVSLTSLVRCGLLV